MSDNSNKDTVSKKALKAGGWYTVSNFLLKAVGFITTPVFTRTLSKTQYGEYTNYNAWLSIVAIVATLEMSSCVVRGRYDFEEDFDAFLSSIIAFGTVITLGFYLIVNIFMQYFAVVLDMQPVYIHLMFMNVMISPALSILQAKHRILQKYKSFVFVAVGTTISSTLISLVCVMNMEDKLFGRIFGMTVPLLVVYLGAYILMMARGRCIYKAEYWKYSFVFCIPLVPHLLSNTILGSSDRIMIKHICGAEDAAVYSVAYSCGMIITILFTSLNQAWEPWLFDRINSGDYVSIKRYSKVYLIFFVILVMGSILVAPELIYIMGGRDYYDAVYAIPPVMTGYGCKFAYTFYVNIEKFEKKTAYISTGTLAAAGLNVVLNLVFIPVFGYIAAAYTTLAGFFALVFFHYIICKKQKLTQMYDNVFIFMTVIIMIAAGIVCQLLYGNQMLRYAVIVLTGVCACAMALKLKNKLLPANR